MSAQALSSGSAARLTAVIGLALALGYAVTLTGSWLGGDWLIDAHGLPVANDFVNVWAAGDLALHGHAPDAYNWTLHKAAEVRAVGHDFNNYYGWHYPPTFLFAAAAIALLPYTTAALAWLAATLCAYVVVASKIVGDRVGIFVALGFPAVLWNATAGQNGFLTAALVGGTLSLMERRPALSGICLGLLTYKPHFGLLFPIALIAGARWRVIAVGSIVTAAMVALSFIVFGRASWQGFVDWLPITSSVVMGEGAAGWNRLQSLFGLLRSLGGGENLAWSAQAALALALAGVIAWLWRNGAEFEIKAAALSCAALLATPYIYMYDLVVLAIPVAFLLRLSLARGFLTHEIAGIGIACLLILIFPFVKAPVGFAAVLLVAALIAHQLFAPQNARA